MTGNIYREGRISSAWQRYIPWLAGVLILGFLIKTATANGDFKVLLEAAKLIAAGKNPYHLWIFVSEGNYDLYYYSPLCALLLVPFTYLPYFIPNFIWLLANAWFLYRTWVLLNKYIAIHCLTRGQKGWLLLVTIVLSARYILYNFEMMQMTVFLLWGSLESLSQFKKGRAIPGSLLLALIINIKILPIVLLPYLIYRKESKAALYTLLFSVFFLLLPALFTGWQGNLQLLSSWWNSINPVNAEHLAETDLGLHSLTALVPTLFTRTPGLLPYARNILDLDPGTTTLILNGTRLFLVLVTLRFLAWPPFTRAKSGPAALRELSYIFLLVPLIFPHQQKYAFLLAAPAMFYLTHYVITHFEDRESRRDAVLFNTACIFLAASFVLMTLTTDGLIGRHLNAITQHYKAVTYGALLLIIPLALCKPGYDRDHGQEESW